MKKVKKIIKTSLIIIGLLIASVLISLAFTSQLEMPEVAEETAEALVQSNTTDNSISDIGELRVTMEIQMRILCMETNYK